MGRVWPHLIVDATPSLDDPARLGQGGEQRLVQAFVAEALRALLRSQ